MLALLFNRHAGLWTGYCKWPHCATGAEHNFRCFILRDGSPLFPTGPGGLSRLRASFTSCGLPFHHRFQGLVLWIKHIPVESTEICTLQTCLSAACEQVFSCINQHPLLESLPLTSMDTKMSWVFFRKTQTTMRQKTPLSSQKEGHLNKKRLYMYN